MLVAPMLSALVLLVTPLRVQAASSGPQVDASVQVTNDSAASRGHATPVLAVSPKDANVVALTEGDAYTSKCAVHISTNGGLTWRTATQPEIPAPWTGCEFSVTGEIGSLAFGGDGTLYYALTGFNPKNYQQQVFLGRSTDLGGSWQTTQLPRIAPDPAKSEFGADALPSVLVDRQHPSKVYVAWWSNNGMWNLPDSLSGGKGWCKGTSPIIARPWVAASTDGGKTFSAPVDMAPGIAGCTTEPYLTGGSNGEVYAVFGQETRGTAGNVPPAHVFFSASRDGGKSFTVAPIHTQPVPTDGSAAKSTSQWLSAPSPGVDPGSGQLYVAWEEMSTGPPQILFMRSSDGGKSWSAPKKLNDVDPLRQWSFTEEFPKLSVAPNGRIDVAWYDFRNDPTFVKHPDPKDDKNNFQDVYYTSSTDGGLSWGPNVRVTDRILDRRFGPRTTGYITGPVGLASTSKVAYVAWDDTRNGTETTGTQDVYFTRARYAPAPDVFGGTTKKARSPFIWVAVGAGAALIVGGLVLLIAKRVSPAHPG